MKTPPSAYTSLAFLINYISAHRTTDLSTAQVRTAARDGNLTRLLASRYGDIADFHYLTRKPAALKHIDAGLADAAGALAWNESRRIGVSSSGLCLAMAIVLEAIQQQFHHLSPNPIPLTAAAPKRPLLPAKR